ncbi:MAG: hypothetical protein JXR10_06850 [Cyclobacteriaceae bacterium]
MIITNNKKIDLEQLKKRLEIHLDGSVIGLDFVAVGNDVEKYDVHLLHADSNEYLNQLGKIYFGFGLPSLLLNPNKVFIEYYKGQMFDANKRFSASEYLNKTISQTTEKYWLDADDEAWKLNVNSWNDAVRKYNNHITHFAYLKYDIGNDRQRFHTALFLYISVRGTLDEDLVLSLMESFLFGDALEHLVPRQLKDIREKAISSHVTRILSRNFSHHIGSHVATRSTLTAYKNRVKDLYGKDFFWIVDKETKRKIQPNTKPYEFFEIYNKNLTNYIVLREEYIANPIRGFQSYFLYRDIIIPFIENRFLMDNITASEGVRYDNKDYNRLKILVSIDGESISFQYKRGTDVVACYPDDLPYLPGLGESLDFFNSKEVVGAHDVKISIPHPHAFYSILENIIRNSAKHNRNSIQQNDRDLVIKIDVAKSASLGLVGITISDNVSVISDHEFNVFKAKEKEELIKNDNEPQMNNLGLMDVKINAGLMMGDQIFNFSTSPPVQIERLDGKLAYHFPMLRKKEIAFIGFENDLKLDEEVYDHFDSIEGFLTNNSIYSLGYEFVVVRSDFENICSSEYMGRVLYIDSLDTIEKPNSLDQNLVLKCWAYWIRANFLGTPINLSVYFQQEKSDYPTSEWIDFAKIFNQLNEKISILPYFNDAGQPDTDEKKRHDNPYNVMMDRHGALMDGRITRFDVNKQGTYLLVDKKSPNFDTVLYTSIFDHPEFIYKYIEACKSSVLILDERIVELSCEQLQGREYDNMLENGWTGNYLKNDRTSFFMPLWAAKVFVGTHIQIRDNTIPIWESLNQEENYVLNVEFKDNGVSLKCNVLSDNLKIPCLLDLELDLSFKAFDYVVMHRTMAKELLGSNPDCLNQIMKYSKIIITSGSSDKHGVEQKTSFISINEILSSLSGQRIDKVDLINKLIQSSIF